MSQKESSNLELLCRTCMTAIPEHAADDRWCLSDKVRGRKESIREFLQTLQPHIRIDMEDKLSKVICYECVQQLQQISEFLLVYAKSDESLRKLLKEAKEQEENSKKLKEVANSSKIYVDEYSIIKLEAEEPQQEEGSATLKESHPEFEAMFIENSLPKDEQHTIDFSDNPIDRGSSSSSNEAEDEWMPLKKSKRITSKKSALQDRIVKKPFNPPIAKTPGHTKKPVSKPPAIIPKPPIPNEDNTLTCEECGKILPDISHWQEHILQHKPATEEGPRKRGRRKILVPKTFKCEICTKVFSRRSIYNTHVLIHSGNFSCLECGKKFKSYDNLNQHMLCHKGERFECKTCGKEYSDEDDYDVHVLSHKNDEPFQCKECGKVLKTLFGLRTHLLRHKGEKKYQCPHCPKSFVVRSGLYGHVKQQHEQRNAFLCDICGKSFRMADNLNKHKRCHSEGQYACEYCDKRFVTPDKQRRHMRTHTGEKPYRCKFCDRAYTQSNECVKHMKQHLGENIYLCELCPMRFPLVRDMRVHFATHKDDDAQTRARNLEAREMEERKIKLKFGLS
uniref:Protein krueppel n=1 Tax=Stomoxys calcitrans TaxID=35570 RepID=A0A1I8PH00_STOCA